MDTKTYNEMKETSLSLIKKAKAKNADLGEYLEKHIILDDRNRSITYTGENGVIEKITEKAVIID